MEENERIIIIKNLCNGNFKEFTKSTLRYIHRISKFKNIHPQNKNGTIFSDPSLKIDRGLDTKPIFYNIKLKLDHWDFFI